MSDGATAVRFATPADAPAMHAIEKRCFSDPWSEASFRSMLDHPQVHARIAERDGRVIGYSVAWIVADEAELANLAVAPDARRGGIGAALLDDLLRAVDGHGGGTTWLEVRAGNAAARALYESRGFAEVGRRTDYYRAPVEDAVMMRRRSAAADGPPDGPAG